MITRTQGRARHLGFSEDSRCEHKEIRVYRESRVAICADCDAAVTAWTVIEQLQDQLETAERECNTAHAHAMKLAWACIVMSIGIFGAGIAGFLILYVFD